MNATSNLKSIIFEAVSHDVSRLLEYTTRTHRGEADPENPDKCWRHDVTYKFTNGDEVTLLATSVGQMVFPASEGFEELVFGRPDSDDPQTFDIAGHIKRAPVIGWRVVDDGCDSTVRPITAYDDNCLYGDSYYAVATPTGRLVGGSPLGVPYECVDAWIAAIRDLWAAHLKEIAARDEENNPCRHCGHRRDDDFDKDIPF